jgi:hypothetical protein
MRGHNLHNEKFKQAREELLQKSKENPDACFKMLVVGFKGKEDYIYRDGIETIQLSSEPKFRGRAFTFPILDEYYTDLEPWEQIQEAVWRAEND